MFNTFENDLEEMKSLDYDMQRDSNIVQKVKDDDYAAKLYGSLTNITWIHKETNTNWTGSFRHVGGIVADLRPRKRDYSEDYLDWYMSSEEGVVNLEIEDDLNKIGWYQSKEIDSKKE
jgi:hypothetical protein